MTLLVNNAGTCGVERCEWQIQDRLSLSSNDRFIREVRDGFLVMRQRTPAAEAALARLLPDPDRAFDPSRMLKVGSRTHAGIIEAGGRRYVLKRYNCRGWWYRISNAFRRSRGVRTWLLNWQYLVRGMPVPEPLICLEERRCRLLGRSYLLMEYCDDTSPLRLCWPLLEEAEKRRLMEQFGELMGTMHRRGIIHGDLKWDNLLVGRESAPETVHLIDLDGSKVLTRWDRSRARKDLDRFLKDLEKYEGNTPLREQLITVWEQCLHVPC